MPDAEPSAVADGRWLQLALGLVAFLPFHAVLVVSASLPTIQREFDTGGRPAGWLVSASLAGIGVGYLVSGTVSDRWGRRPMLLLGLSTFVAASLGQAVVSDFDSLLHIRVVQAGAAGAALILAGPIFKDLHPADFVALARGNFLVGICAAMGPILGSPSGALFEATLGWRAAMIWLALLGCIAGALCWRFVPETLATPSSLVGSVRGLVSTLLIPRLWLASLVGSAGLGVAYIFLNAAPMLVIGTWERSPAFFGAIAAIPTVASVAVALAVRHLANASRLPKWSVMAAALQTVAGVGLYLAWSNGRLSLESFYAAATVCSMCNGVLTSYSTSLALSFADRSTGAAGAIVGCIHLAGAVLGAHLSATAAGVDAFGASAFVGVLGAASLFVCIGFASTPMSLAGSGRHRQ